MTDSLLLTLANVCSAWIQACCIYHACACFLHCFYDDAIVLSPRRSLTACGSFIGVLVMMLPITCFLSFVLGVIIGATEADTQRYYTPTPEDIDLFITVVSIPIYATMLLMIAFVKGTGFKATVRRFLTALITMLLVIVGVDLITEIILYCATESGVFSKHLMEVRTEELIVLQLVNSLFCGIGALVLYFRAYKKGIALRMRRVDYLALGIYGIIEAMMYIFFKEIEKQNISIAGGNLLLRSIVLGIMLLLLILIPVLIVRSRISASYQERNAYQESFLETELQASRQYKAAQEDTRAFRHDVQNNLTAIAMLMQEGKMEDAQHYLNDMRTEIGALSPKVVTGDDMVDSLISAKLSKMEELGITFKSDGVIDGGLKWKPMDICTVFANLLDNAIEAAAQTENGFITLEFRKSEHHRLIHASNSCAEDIDCEALMSGSHITSKPDKMLHGYGLGNIRKTVEKYGGMMRISCVNRVFTLELLLAR